MALVPEGDDEGKFTDDFRARLLQGRLDVVTGKTLTSAEVARRLGL